MSKGEANTDRRTHRYLGLQTKLGISFSIVATILSAFVTFALYLIVKTQLRQDIRQRLCDIVNIAALQVDGDAHATLVEPAQEGNATYMRIKHVLQNIRDRGTGIRFVYTWRRDANGRIIFVVDAETDPNEISHLGDIYSSAEPAILSQLATLDHTMVDKELNTDRWGTWLSGYTPFYRSDGQMEGILGIDIAASKVLSHERQFLWVALGVFCATIPLAMALGRLFGRKLAAPIIELTVGSKHIAEGDLNHRIQVQSNDEVGTLAKTFNEMTRTLQETIMSRDREIMTRKKSVEKYHSLIANIPDVVWTTDCKGNTVFISPNVERVYGYSPEEIYKGAECLWFGRVHPDDIGKVKKAFKALFEKGRRLDIDYRIKRKDGQWVWLHDRSIVTYEKDGVMYADGLFADITERKKAEAALRKSEKRFKQVAENAGEWIWEVNIEGLYTYSSPIVKEILGYKPEEIVGKKYFYDFFAPDVKDELRKAALNAFAAKESFKGFINPNVHKNGSTVILETNGSSVLDDEGNLCGYRGADIDITQHRKAEEKQAQLLKELENTNRELKDFMYIASHDLKSPLRGIRTLAQWLSADYASKLGEQGEEQMDLLLRRAERMHNMIEGILQYSRIGRVKENRAVVNLNKLVHEVIDRIAPPENITIAIENELPAIECEPTRIAQVFQNLLGNAVKYMDKPQGQIKVGCVEEDGFWKFSIADNGPGIEERYFGKIFQIFQTLLPHDDFESTGIGLTITKKVVELYGGKIRVESNVGEGSTFFFTLPKQETRPGEVPGRSQMGVKNAKLETNIACGR